MSIVAVGDMTVYSRTYNVHYVTVPLVVCTNIMQQIKLFNNQKIYKGN